MDCASPEPALRGREKLAGVVEKAAEVKSMAPPESAGPAPNPSQADAGPPCFAQDCGQPRVRNQKWCSKHKRAYAAMAAQAKKNGQYESFQELVADENRLLITMREWCERNPPDGKWSRKRNLDFTQYSEARGQLDYAGEGAGDEPKTEAEFLKWAVDVKCLTQSGAGKWWKDLQATCRTDTKGRHPDGSPGATRLWVPSVEVNERKKGRYVDNKVSQSSKQMKKMSAEEVAMLHDYACARPAEEAFLRGERMSKEDEATIMLQLEPTAELSSSAPTTASSKEASNPNPSPVKIVDLALQKPKVAAKHKAELRSVSQSLRDVSEKACEQWKASKDDVQQDSAVASLMSHLKFRLQCVASISNYTFDFLKEVCEGAPQATIAELLDASKDKLPVHEDMVQHLKVNFNQQVANMDALHGISTVQELEDAKDAWVNFKTAVKALEKGVAQAAKDVKAHKAQAEKEKVRLQKVEQKKKEQEQLEAHKENADLRAKAILANKQKLVPGYQACLFLYKKAHGEGPCQLRFWALRRCLQAKWVTCPSRG